MALPMTLGGFPFHRQTLPLERDTRSSEYRWAEHEVLTGDILQYTGATPKTITLSGVAYATQDAIERTILSIVLGAGSPMAMLERMAKSGRPYLLISEAGELLGHYAIVQLDEDHAPDAPKYGDGTPRSLAFTVTLRRYDNHYPRGTA